MAKLHQNMTFNAKAVAYNMQLISAQMLATQNRIFVPFTLCWRLCALGILVGEIVSCAALGRWRQHDMICLTGQIKTHLEMLLIIPVLKQHANGKFYPQTWTLKMLMVPRRLWAVHALAYHIFTSSGSQCAKVIK